MIQSIAPQIRTPQAGSSHADRIALVVDDAVGQDDSAREMTLSWRRCLAEHPHGA